jgi:hypothetical protein
MKKILGFKEFINEHDNWQTSKSNLFSSTSGRNYVVSDPPYSITSGIRGESRMIHQLHSLRTDPHLNYMVASPEFLSASPVIDYISNKIKNN